MILILLLFGPILFLALFAYALARKAAQNAQDAQRMALLASNLEGQLHQSEARAEQLADIAKHAIDEAAKVAGLKADEVWTDSPDSLRTEAEQLREIGMKLKSEANYIAPINAFCPSCNVSVRHGPSEYPVHCPACQTLIDPILDNPPEL